MYTYKNSIFINNNIPSLYNINIIIYKSAMASLYPIKSFSLSLSLSYCILIDLELDNKHNMRSLT